MQRLVSKADMKINNVFDSLPAVSGEEVVAQVTTQTDSLMQGWHHALTTFQELKASTLTEFPKVGTLFR